MKKSKQKGATINGKILNQMVNYGKFKEVNKESYEKLWHKIKSVHTMHF